jgi:predicted nuclease of restriction endonuclease-like RecB superfamily
VMSEYAEPGGEGSFWKDLPDVRGYLEEKLPTLDRTLDRYFDQHAGEIIGEWGLVREDELLDLERRVERATTEISRLGKGREVIRERIARLDARIAKLEEAVR